MAIEKGVLKNACVLLPVVGDADSSVTGVLALDAVPLLRSAGFGDGNGRRDEYLSPESEANDVVDDPLDNGGEMNPVRSWAGVGSRGIHGSAARRKFSEEDACNMLRVAQRGC